MCAAININSGIHSKEVKVQIKYSKHIFKLYLESRRFDHEDGLFQENELQKSKRQFIYKNLPENGAADSKR